MLNWWNCAWRVVYSRVGFMFLYLCRLQPGNIFWLPVADRTKRWRQLCSQPEIWTAGWILLRCPSAWSAGTLLHLRGPLGRDLAAGGAPCCPGCAGWNNGAAAPALEPGSGAGRRSGIVHPQNSSQPARCRGSPAAESLPDVSGWAEYLAWMAPSRRCWNGNPGWLFPGGGGGIGEPSHALRRNGGMWGVQRAHPPGMETCLPGWSCL